MRDELILAACAVAVGLFIGWTIFRDDPTKDRLQTAEQGQALATETGKVIEKTFERTNTIYKQAEASAHAVETARGADVPVPDDVLAGWRSGIDGLRKPPAADDRGSGKPPR